MMLLNAIRIYWRSIFVFVYPLVLLPVFVFDNVAALRCLYVVLLMAGFWVFEALPLPVTSLIPMVLFPLMGVLDSDKVSLCYLKETNMMFVGGLVIAIAVEHCKLHTRVALYVIKIVGCSPRRLNFGLVTVTMLVSMWISNTAATAMMIPIIEATLKELEEQGIGEMYEETSREGQEVHPDNEPKRPTKTTMCYFISTAYAASIGGNGCIIGSGTNLAFKGIFEIRFPKGPGLEFSKWLTINVPMMLLMMYGSLIWLQFFFMGLFRPNSADAKKIRVGKQGEQVARKLIKQKIAELGPMSFHEMAVAALFALSVLLWFFREPHFITGWAELITQHKVEDATAALIVVLLLFIVPSKPDFIYIFSKDETKRPKIASPALITWKVVQQKMPWGLIFLLGAGFTLAEASKTSGMSQLIADHLHGLAELPQVYVMVISSTFACFLTQFSSNVAVASVVLPVLAEVAVVAKIHPLYLMMPAALCSSFAYCLPVSTPPNAIAAAPCNMSSTEMVKAGLGVAIISLVVLFLVYPFLGPLAWDLNTFPAWAAKP
ncbi:protein I'm not dead yet-like isoform X2 [Aethina tumida]|nr:protein I'm not dead yet-like isoform X2 [Aethina tumida]XP_049824490.1 protein I'm not dead yet-like isoform X2 [Aethina tumida]XP_049824491.1 protein I'm not dead yet-like isoform X2 [Aethina tumida]XP_049824492.1 protein I'm not dead yet-like isoform X2 [Aethina tumida]